METMITIMTSVIVGAVVGILLAFSMVGMVYTLGDYRHFDSIVEECKTNQHIQDRNTRVLCEVE